MDLDLLMGGKVSLENTLIVSKWLKEWLSK
jgi:hypothetical protein